VRDNQNDLLELYQNEYLPKVYSFARMKLNGAHEAEELAGEIALQIVRHIRRGGNIGNMSAFVWKVSNNMFCKFLRQKKHGNTVFLSEFIPSCENIEDDIIVSEDIAALRRELALMSEKYRYTVILYYFESKTCEEIAEIIGKPSGTVKWWLHEAKRFIKKGMETMREFGEKSYNPANLTVSCQGNPGADMEPMTCAKRRSAQNILLAAYKQPLTVQELSLELGIAAPYIEDEAEYLTSQHLIKKSGGKYQTDFVILPDCTTGVVEKVYESGVPAYFKELMGLLESSKEKLVSEAFNPAGFAWERLLWMYLHLFTEINLDKFRGEVCKGVYGENIPDRPNGGKWIAIGWGSGFPVIKAVNGFKEYFNA
jgi:RNA polymerase sigma factor (sigma-70 family)